MQEVQAKDRVREATGWDEQSRAALNVCHQTGVLGSLLEVSEAVQVEEAGWQWQGRAKFPPNVLFSACKLGMIGESDSWLQRVQPT